MSGHFRIFAFFLLLAASCCLGETLKLGINRTNLAWVESKERQFEILDEIHALGVKSIRLAMPMPHRPTYDHIEYCNKLGMDVVLLVLGAEKDLYYDPDIKLREGDGEVIYNLPPLSQINVDQFFALFRYYMITLREQNLKVEAVQIFNELNWAAFNGDLPMVEGGAYVTAENYKDFPFAENWFAGIRKYRTILREACKITDWVFRKKPQLKPKIITCGYPWPDERFLEKVSGSVVDPNLFFDILSGKHPLAQSDMNVFDYVDGAGVHLYPEPFDADPVSGVETATRVIEHELGPMLRATGGKLPIYITEWGYSGWKGGVKQSEEIRLEQFRVFLRALESKPFEDLKFKELMLFDYDIMPPFSIYQDGKLTPAARIFEDRFKRK